MTPATTAKYRYVHVNDPGSKLRGQTKSPTTVLMGDEDDYKRCIPEIFMDVPGQVRLGKCQVKLQTHTLQSSPGRCRCRVGIIINISSIMPSRLLTGKGYMLPVSSPHPGSAKPFDHADITFAVVKFQELYCDTRPGILSAHIQLAWSRGASSA